MFGIEFAQTIHRVFEDKFPSIDKTICYGSKVFPQTSTNITHKPTTKHETNSKPTKLNNLKTQLKRSMMDCIFVVDNPRQWHAKNLLLNPKHYSLFMRYCGAKTITQFQSIGGGILYNAYIDINWKNYNKKLNNDLQIKYGVIATSQLISDLLYWDSCYIAGRLHKPVLMIKNSKNTLYSNDIMKQYNNTSELNKKLKEIYKRSINKQSVNLNDAMLLNWDFSVRIALLLIICTKLKDNPTQMNRFTMDDIVHNIVSISYFGDDRMSFVEDTKKIDKIVNGSKEYLVQIYKPFLRQYVKECDDGYYECNVSIDYLISQLPENVLYGINTYDRSLFVVKDDKPRYDEWVHIAIKESISKIIKKSSRKQVIKSFVTTDIHKIAFYFCQKVYKRILSGYDS